MVHVTYGPPGSHYGPVQLWTRSLMGHYIVVMVHPYLLLCCTTVIYFRQIELGQIFYKHI